MTAILFVLLIVSLALNAFFIGAAWRVGAFAPQRVAGSDLIMNPRAFMAELSPETRGKVLKELRTHRGEFQQNFLEIVGSRRAVLEAMKADPFDAVAYRQALDSSAAIDTRARQQAIGLFVKIVENLTPEERKAIAERLERSGGGWGRRVWRQRRIDRRFDPPPGPPPAEIQGTE
jgi:uncharacterized membrane protein